MEKKNIEKKEKNPRAQDAIRLEPVSIGIRRCCPEM
jgi:hypothetical protein